MELTNQAQTIMMKSPDELRKSLTKNNKKIIQTRIKIEITQAIIIEVIATRQEIISKIIVNSNKEITITKPVAIIIRDHTISRPEVIIMKIIRLIRKVIKIIKKQINYIITKHNKIKIKTLGRKQIIIHN